MGTLYLIIGINGRFISWYYAILSYLKELTAPAHRRSSTYSQSGLNQADFTLRRSLPTDRQADFCAQCLKATLNLTREQLRIFLRQTARNTFGARAQKTAASKALRKAAKSS